MHFPTDAIIYTCPEGRIGYLMVRSKRIFENSKKPCNIGWITKCEAKTFDLAASHVYLKRKNFDIVEEAIA